MPEKQKFNPLKCFQAALGIACLLVLCQSAAFSQEISCGDVVTTNGDFTFAGEAGELVSIFLVMTNQPSTSTGVPIFDLFIQGPGGESFLSDAGSGLYDFELPRTATYTVHRESNGTAGQGALSLEWLSPGSLQCPDVELGFGDGLTRSLPPGATDLFQLSGVKGASFGFDFTNHLTDTVRITLGSFTFDVPIFAPTLRLDGPDLTQLLDLEPGTHAFEFPVDGSYTLRVFGQYGGAWSDSGGSYTLELSPLTAPPERFVRGDANGDGRANIADASFIANFLFGIAPATAPPCEKAANANGDRSLNIADTSYLANFIFGVEPATPPPAPHPDCGTSGFDEGMLGCADTTACDES